MEEGGKATSHGTHSSPHDQRTEIDRKENWFTFMRSPLSIAPAAATLRCIGLAHEAENALGGCCEVESECIREVGER